ncbi:MAG: serine protease [Pseudomonadales bacterium]|nr:serine protease [Pseudomonadales bacterium]
MSASALVVAEEDASSLFSELKKQVYQIRVIDLASDDKSAIGSGFLISDTGLIATNFHVVSSYVHEPSKYRLEYVDYLGGTGSIELQSIDVVHDLAIGKISIGKIAIGKIEIDKAVTDISNTQGSNFFSFNLGEMSQGERLYSVGNPLDLGMTIIEGIYNGLIKKSRYKKILFSGSLNSGMSGGPALDSKGQVIGINVAKGSEQLSFLVPVEYLHVLLIKLAEKGPEKDFEQSITEALTNDQRRFYAELLGRDWQKEKFMEAILPTKISDKLECWGHTEDKEEYLYKGVHQHCRSSDDIYLSGTLSTGHFSYSYEWNESTQLNSAQFYNVLERRFDHRGLNNIYEEKDGTNFSCHTEFVTLSQHEWKISSCLRGYKMYRGLYDASFVMASVDTRDKGLIIRGAAAGLSKENVQGMIRKFLEAVEWTR